VLVIDDVDGRGAGAAPDAGDGPDHHDVFEVIEISGDCDRIRVRSLLLFELGEQLRIVVERDGHSFEATARVRAHTGPLEARITELEIVARVERTP